MSARSAVGKRPPALVPASHEALFAGVPTPLFAVDADDRLTVVNPAAEEFFGAGAVQLRGRALADAVSYDSPLLALVGQVRDRGVPAFDYEVELRGPRMAARRVNLQAAPLAGPAGQVVVALQPVRRAERLDGPRASHRAARSVRALAAMLAHEIKNPLAGIRGAAQLLEASAPPADRPLTRLICDEVDRIRAIVDRMEPFDEDTLARSAVNIHEVLDHVRTLARAGFARHVAFEERYDPSLPPVLGDRDQLVQVFLNLVKNAAEAVPAAGGRIVLRTSYRHTLWLDAGGRERAHLPLEVAVGDNGPGIPEEVQPHVFEPFVTTKLGGSGLGLALVAKLVSDHGGIIELETGSGGTEFRVRLPVVDERAPPFGAGGRGQR